MWTRGRDSSRFALTQNVAAPKPRRCEPRDASVLLSLRTSLLQNRLLDGSDGRQVLLSLRTSLLQNRDTMTDLTDQFCSHSERRCSKTLAHLLGVGAGFALTQNVAAPKLPPAHSSRPCVLLSLRTSLLQNKAASAAASTVFCSHSERRCSKTPLSLSESRSSFALTQNVAAPKPQMEQNPCCRGRTCW